MTPIKEGELAKQVATTESIAKSGETRHPLSQVVGKMSDIAITMVEADPQIVRGALWRKLLEDPTIDDFVKEYDKDDYESLPIMALNTVLGDIYDLDKVFLNNLQLILDGKSLDQWERLTGKINRGTINNPKDLSLILSVAKTAIPNFLLNGAEEQPAKDISATTRGEGYLPAAGMDSLNKWSVDFRSFQKNPTLVDELLALGN